MTKRAINLVADGPPVNGARVGTKPSSRRKPYDDKSQDMTRESHSHLVDQDRTTALLPVSLTNRDRRSRDFQPS